MVHRDYVVRDVNMIMRQVRTLCMPLAALFVVVSIMGAQPAGAAAFGPLDSPDRQGTGEIMEPSYGPSVSPRDRESKDPAALQSIPEPSFEVYESLDRDISRSKKGSNQRNRSSSFFGVEGLSGLPLSLSAEEWTRQMDEDGY